MQHQLNCDALAVDFHRDRIHQKRHVVVDEFNDGGCSFPAVLCQFWIENAHLWRARLEFTAECKMRKRKGGPFGRVACDEVFGVDFIAIFGGKYLGVCALGGERLGVDQFFNFRKQGGFAIFCLGGHCVPEVFYRVEIIFLRRRAYCPSAPAA